MTYQALSIVGTGCSKIAAGLKTIEVRSWPPPVVPMKDLLIVQNTIYLKKDGDFDPDGEAVALVDVNHVEPWTQDQFEAATAGTFKAGLTGWHLTNVRKVKCNNRVLAARKIYEVEVDLEILR